MPNPGVNSLADALRRAPARLGSTRLLLLDGPAGAGKTTVAGSIAVALGGSPSPGAGEFDPASPLPDDAPVQVLHGDDLYEGWDGLPELDRVLVDGVLDPLSQGREGAFRMWDWERGRRTHLIRVPAREFLVIEGVGVASRAARVFASLAVVVDAPWSVRLARGIARDGESMRSQWERWHEVEDSYLRDQGTFAAADVVIDGTRPVPP